MASNSLTKKYVAMKQRLLGAPDPLAPSLTIPVENLFPSYVTALTPFSQKSTAKSCEQSLLHTSQNEQQEANAELKKPQKVLRPVTAKHSPRARKLSASAVPKTNVQKPSNLLINSVGFTLGNEAIKSPNGNLPPEGRPKTGIKPKSLGINPFQIQNQLNQVAYSKPEGELRSEMFDQFSSNQTGDTLDNINFVKTNKSKPPKLNLPLKDNLQALLGDIPLDLLKRSNTNLFEDGSSTKRSGKNVKVQDNGSNTARTVVSQKSCNTSAHLAKMMSPYNSTRANSPRYCSTARDNKALSRISSFANRDSCSPKSSRGWQEGTPNMKRSEQGEDDSLNIRYDSLKISFPVVNLTPRMSPRLEHQMTKKYSVFSTPKSGRNTPSLFEQRVGIRKRSRRVSDILKQDVQPKDQEANKEEDGKEEEKLVPIKQKNIGMPSQIGSFLKEAEEIHENLNLANKDWEIMQAWHQKPISTNYEFLKVNPEMLTELDFKVIITEFEKKARGHEEVNYKALDHAIKSLKFFIHLPIHLRLEILRSSMLAQYPPKQFLFREGDYGDMVYIILRGAVNVRSNKNTIFGVIADVIVTVLYDGTCFGDYAVMGTSQKSKQPGAVAQSQQQTQITQLSQHSQMNIKDDSSIKEEKPVINKNSSLLLEPPKEETLRRKSTMLEPPKEETLRRKNSSYLESSRIEEPKESKSSLYQEKTRRMATIETCESCDVLCIPRKQFQNIFLRLVQKEIDDKLKVLIALPFFQDLDPFTLIPVANNLIPRVYHYKQVIISRGDSVDKLMIVANGRCGLVLQTARVSSMEPPTKIKGLRTNLRQFKVGLTDYMPQDISEPVETKKKPEKDHMIASRGTTRSFNFDKLGVKSNHVIYTDNIHFGSISEGGSFGGRALLTEQDLENQKFLAPRNVGLDEPARLSVLADSTEVEILELDREHMKYIPEFIQTIIKTGLMNIKEFDDYDVDSEIKAVQEWGDLKDRNIKDVFTRIQKPYGADYKKF